MKIEISNRLIIHAPPRSLQTDLTDRLTFENPRYLENERHGYWNGDTPRRLKFYEAKDNTLITPRGYARQLLSLCKRLDVKYELVDKRRILPEVGGGAFQGRLRPFQIQACEAIAKRDFGTLSAPTGAGKTVCGLWLISLRKQPALVITHTKELMYQWQDRACQFLDIQPDEIGLIGDGHKSIGKRLTIAIVNSVYKVASQISERIGFVIADECHRCPSRTFTEAVRVFDSRYMLGLSATPWRRDKLSRLIYWFLGDKVYEIDKAELIKSQDILPAEVTVRETSFRPWHDSSNEYSKMLSELTGDPERNALIASDVAREARNGGGICLVLSDRKGHCKTLQEELADRGVKSELLTGDLSNGQRKQVVEDLNAGKIKVLIATGQLIGEGFDQKALSTLFLSTPIKFSGRLLQYLGRVLRPAPGKRKAIVYDYVDVNVGVLRAAAKARMQVYRGNTN